MVHRVPRQQASTLRSSGIISFQASESTYPRGFGLYYDGTVRRDGWMEAQIISFQHCQLGSTTIQHGQQSWKRKQRHRNRSWTYLERHTALIVAILSTEMMNFAILLLLFKYSNACLTTPDMDLPPVQPTTYTDLFWQLRKLSKNRYRYDGIHPFDNDDLHNTWLHVVNIDYNDHIDTYNHVHINIHNVHNDHNNYIHHNNNYYT
ncbi:hypothetical protein WR25_12835 [Diploscapter pachys]|uniref:Uncharacterized protein n=1 Tax=Diploscapter pachys TaxID=2018661 RepID=A0A2A2JB31_9BILA|nr:hypothetical protein WR25_12835 [Diploscapter pachys]